MKKIIRKPVLYVLLLGAILIISCNQNDEITTEENTSSNVHTHDDPIDPSTIRPEALDFYKNISAVSEFYIKNPDELLSHKNTSAEDENTLLNKLKQITLVDSLGQEMNVFDLEKDQAIGFLQDTWAVSLAKDLSDKLDLDTSNTMMQSIVETNEIVEEANLGNKSSDGSFKKDPYWKIRELMQSKNPSKSVVDTALVSKSSSGFWATVIANRILSIGPVAYKNTLPTQTFYNRIKNSLEPGRLLIALPGGFNLFSPIVASIGSEGGYDVGHVAIINRNRSQADSEIRNFGINDLNITIGLNAKKHMHLENLWESWAKEHGVAFVGEVRKSWWAWNGWRCRWWHGCLPTWVRKSRSINGEIYRHSKYQLAAKRPYIHWYEIFTAKWAAPYRYICSTSAWYAAKEEGGVDISSWWKFTIYPAGVYLSDEVHIIDNTLW